MVADTILSEVVGCQPTALLPLLVDSAPSPQLLAKLENRWEEIHEGVKSLIESLVRNVFFLFLVK